MQLKTCLTKCQQQQKPRKTNFLATEIEVLVDCVSTNYGTLYGKFSPSLTSATKAATWQEVADR
jgi:hypothetical protein